MVREYYEKARAAWGGGDEDENDNGENKARQKMGRKPMITRIVQVSKSVFISCRHGKSRFSSVNYQLHIAQEKGLCSDNEVVLYWLEKAKGMGF